jgi:hypothetical protein
MSRPDFGTVLDERILGDRRIVLKAKCVAPGLTLSDLVGIFEGAPSAERGVAAVADAILDAVYQAA